VAALVVSGDVKNAVEVLPTEFAQQLEVVVA
jgi:hypothetical protein